MSKIHPGFTAVVILLGPAALIIGHQKLSNYFSSTSRSHTDPVQVSQQIEVSRVGDPAAPIAIRRVAP